MTEITTAPTILTVPVSAGQTTTPNCAGEKVIILFAEAVYYILNLIKFFIFRYDISNGAS